MPHGVLALARRLEPVRRQLSPPRRLLAAHHAIRREPPRARYRRLFRRAGRRRRSAPCCPGPGKFGARRGNRRRRARPSRRHDPRTVFLCACIDTEHPHDRQEHDLPPEVLTRRRAGRRGFLRDRHHGRRRASRARDFPDGKQGDVLTVEFTLMGIPCIGLSGPRSSRRGVLVPGRDRGPGRKPTATGTRSSATAGGKAPVRLVTKDRWGVSWQITPRADRGLHRRADRAAAARVRGDDGHAQDRRRHDRAAVRGDSWNARVSGIPRRKDQR